MTSCGTVRAGARMPEGASGGASYTWGVAAHVEQGKLLCDDWGILQAQLDFILAALNQALGHFGDDRP